MKKLKNKFIIVVISIIFLIICSQVYIAYKSNAIDTNSYLALIKGNGTLNDNRLELGDKYILTSGDKVRIIGSSSLGVIEWGDGSLTRLGGNTKISIENNKVSRDLTNIDISFDLIAGKTWSNVVSFIGKDSSFSQSFNGIEAGVRGTVFDVDLENEFIRVTDHVVELQDDLGNTLILGEGEVASLKESLLSRIPDFISSLEDNTWSELNKNFDKEYFIGLTSNLESSLQERNPFLFILEWFSPKYRILYELDTTDNFSSVEKIINKLSEANRKKVYDIVLSKYQGMNFIQAGDDLFIRKTLYKMALSQLAYDDYDRQQLVRSSAYDLQDIIDLKSSVGLKETLSVLSDNTDVLQDMDSSILIGGLDYLPEGLLEEFQLNFNQLQDILGINFKSIASRDVGDLLETADGAIQEFLDKNVGGLLQNIAQ